MYIEKRIIAAWNSEEEMTISLFRDFLHEKMRELEHRKIDNEFKELYDCLNKLDRDLEYIVDDDYIMTVETNDLEDK